MESLFGANYPDAYHTKCSMEFQEVHVHIAIRNGNQTLKLDQYTETNEPSTVTRRRSVLHECKGASTIFTKP